MKIFISWSGELSQQLGNAFKDWIPDVLQAVQPYFTPEDIKKGERWGSNIARELEESSFGVFCVTRENLSSSWMNFEAGAISNNKKNSQVCPILFDLHPTDVTGPLQQFQATVFSKKEIYKLIRAMNDKLNKQALPGDRLERQFSRVWPQLENEVNKILSCRVESLSTTPMRTDRELLEEILSHIRDIRKENQSEKIIISSDCNIKEISDCFIRLINSYIVAVDNLKYDFVQKKDVAFDLYSLKEYLVNMIYLLPMKTENKNILYDKIISLSFDIENS